MKYESNKNQTAISRLLLKWFRVFFPIQNDPGIAEASAVAKDQLYMFMHEKNCKWHYPQSIGYLIGTFFYCSIGTIGIFICTLG